MADSEQRPTIGWIGTGVMGLSMCRRLIEAGYALEVFTRTPAKADPILGLGATWRASPAEVAQHAQTVLTMVGYPSDVEEVYLGREGIFEGVRRESVLVDFTTTRPSLAQKLAKIATEKSACFLDAPVSGGDVGARNGQLSIMVGGDEGALSALMPIMRLLGTNIVHQGPAGAGQHTKMVNQITIAGTMVGTCEALLYGYKAGLDLPTVLRSISGGAAGCWTLDHLAPRMLARNFDPGFFVDHFIKDMEIALDEARRMALSLPGLALVHQLYTALRAQGDGKLGTHALLRALERLSNISPLEENS